MIRHLVLFKLNEGIDRESDAGVAAGVKAFEELGALVPGVRQWECGWNTTSRDIAYDFAISSLLDDRDALQVYADHPAHQAAVAQWREFSTWVIADIEV